MELSQVVNRFPYAWNVCHGAFYQVSDLDLAWNLAEQALLQYRETEVAGVPVLLAEASSKGVEAGISAKTIWLSLWGNLGAVDLGAFTDDLEALVRAQEKTRLVIGGEEFHSIPGVPLENQVGLRFSEHLRSREYSLAEAVDYVGSPLSEKVSAYTVEALRLAEKNGWRLCPVENNRDRERLTNYLNKEFKGRWAREWQHWLVLPGAGLGVWNFLLDDHEAVLGFSRIAVAGSRSASGARWLPGALRLPLRETGERRDSDSCLGPIGVSGSERGRGAGKVLLGLSLKALVDAGAKETCIDWTNAYNYYSPLDFRVARKYATGWKDF